MHLFKHYPGISNNKLIYPFIISSYSFDLNKPSSKKSANIHRVADKSQKSLTETWPSASTHNPL